VRLFLIFVSLAVVSCPLGIGLQSAESPGLPRPAEAAVNVARTYYVATTGSDNNAGSSAHPFLSLQKAADTVEPGDTVIVRDGVYSAAAGDRLVAITRSGRPEAPITFRAEHKWRAELNGRDNATAVAVEFEGSRYIRFEDFSIEGFGSASGGGAFWIHSAADHIYIAGNSIHDLGRLSTDTRNAAGFGVYAEGDYFTIEANAFFNIGRLAPGENGAAPTTTNWQDHDHGIYLNGVSHVEILKNTFYAHKHGWAIQVYGRPTTDLVIADNIFTGANPNRPAQIMLGQTMSRVSISNNFFDRPLSAGIEDFEPNFSDVSITHNTTTAAAIYSGTPPAGVSVAENVTLSDRSPAHITNREGSIASDTGTRHRGFNTTVVIGALMLLVLLRVPLRRFVSARLKKRSRSGTRFN
jgi:hypothetical protein